MAHRRRHRSPRSLRSLCALLVALTLPVLAGAPSTGGTERQPRPHSGKAAVSASASATASATTQARVIVKYRSTASTAASAGGQSTLSTIARANTGTTASASADAPALSDSASALERPQRAARMATRLGRSLRDGIVVGPRAQVLHASGITSEALASQLAADPDVEYAEPDQWVSIASAPNDPLYAANQPTATPAVGQWYLRAPNSVTVSAINAEAAWAQGTGSGVVVAVLDTGVRLTHPDLAGKLLQGYDFVSDATLAQDGQASTGSDRDDDPTDPGDWAAAGVCGTGSEASESSWHGTQVAGLIGAMTHNSLGMAGAARDAMILPVRVLGRCGGYQSDIVAGMRWAAGLSTVPVSNPHPAKVVNLSLGSSGTCSNTYQTAVSELAAAGVVTVVAAGNGAGLAAQQPANCNGAIGVAGVRHTGTKVGYSNIGPSIAIAAPAGNCVNLTGDCLYPLLTTSNSGSTVPESDIYTDGGNTASLGTSFATPLVSATVAMMLSANPALTPAQVKTALQASARPFPATSTDTSIPACVAPTSTAQVECHCTTSTCGAGLLDAAAAVAYGDTMPAASNDSGGGGGALGLGWLAGLALAVCALAWPRARSADPAR
jgi:serine protease